MYNLFGMLISGASRLCWNNRVSSPLQHMLHGTSRRNESSSSKQYNMPILQKTRKGKAVGQSPTQTRQLKPPSAQSSPHMNTKPGPYRSGIELVLPQVFQTRVADSCLAENLGLVLSRRRWGESGGCGDLLVRSTEEWWLGPPAHHWFLFPCSGCDWKLRWWKTTW